MRAQTAQGDKGCGSTARGCMERRGKRQQHNRMETCTMPPPHSNLHSLPASLANYSKPSAERVCTTQPACQAPKLRRSQDNRHVQGLMAQLRRRWSPNPETRTLSGPASEETGPEASELADVAAMKS